MRLDIEKPERKTKAYRVVMSDSEDRMLKEVAAYYEVNASEAIRAMIKTSFESIGKKG